MNEFAVFGESPHIDALDGDDTKLQGNENTKLSQMKILWKKGKKIEIKFQK